MVLSKSTIPRIWLSPRVTIEFRPQNKKTRVPFGMSIFNAANWIGLPIDSTCGGQGTCGKCKVLVWGKGNPEINAADREFLSDSELLEGWRLSCRSLANQDLVCEVPTLIGNPKASLMGTDRQVIIEPNVHKIALQLQKPSLRDQRSDYTRIRDALIEKGKDLTREFFQNLVNDAILAENPFLAAW